MSLNDPIREFRDPLMAQLDQARSERRRPAAPAEATKPAGRGPWLVLGSALVLLALGVAGYFIYQSQQRIELLSQQLTVSRQDLVQVGDELRQSQERIAELNDGLDKSREQIVRQDRELNRQQSLYRDIRSEQEQQTRELVSLNAQKADQAEVIRLRSEADAIKGRLESTDGKLTETQTQVSGLDARTRQHEDAINRNRADLDTVRVSAERNTTDLGELKRSLEREYFNFELQQGGGYMKVLNVSLNLRKTDFERRQCDLYLLADGKVIRKQGQPINEPIFFYVEGKEKPYEVVITRVDRKLVVGYLSVPKV